MGHSNYKLNEEQKQSLSIIADAIIEDLEDHLDEFPELDVYDADGKFDNNKFTAIVWYIGDKLSSY